MNEQLRHIRTIYDRNKVPFGVYHGYTFGIVRQLVVNSTQEEILEQTPKDVSNRFKSEMHFYAGWVDRVAGEHQTYPLISSHGVLAGFAWCNVQPFTETQPFEDAAYEKTDGAMLPQDTLELRLYKGFAGRGLARDYAGALVTDYANARMNGPQEDRPVFTGMWGEYRDSNERARATLADLSHTRMGFDRVLGYNGWAVDMVSVDTLTHIAAITASLNARFDPRPLQNNAGA